jgi:DNA-binding Lrp family transcriptional regulator
VRREGLTSDATRAPADAPVPRAELDELDRLILNRTQQDLPLVPEPFSAVAAELGIDEADLLARLRAMKARGDISRVGPMYRVDGFGGGLALMAMAVPSGRFEEVAATVNAMPEVAHNYEREHVLNMWFVVAAETPTELAATVEAIESATGLEVHAFPKEREYFLELKLDV